MALDLHKYFTKADFPTKRFQKNLNCNLIMAKDAAYRSAEKHIEEARRSRTRTLHLRGFASEGSTLTELPESLGQLTRLRRLSLSFNRLTALPEWLAKLTQLESLDLSGNPLSTLPEWLAKLAQLQSLDLSANVLWALPDWLGDLSRLRTLSLSHNQLTVLPEWLAKLAQLQSLDLSQNQLTALPESLSQLTQLKVLDLWGNHFNEIPQCIFSLKELVQLSLSDTGLVSLSPRIAELTKLQQFYLGGNKFDHLPEEISNMYELRTLVLGGIERSGTWGVSHPLPGTISDLPPRIIQLPKLKTLTLDNNPLNPELAAAYKEGFVAVKRYLKAKAEAQVVLNEAKLILIGEGNVGKSSLLGALRGDPWMEKRPTTHGVEIKPVKVREQESGKEIDLNAWDFGGQPLYRPTHQLFFTSPAIYLVVWEPRLGPEQCCVNEWIKLVRNRACDEARPDDRPRVLIVATHGGPKERRDHIDQEAIRKQFGNLIVDFHQVDSLGEQGIEVLRQAIARTAVGIRQVGRSVPASWKRVLDAIRERSTRDPYITYAAFEALCESQQIEPDLASTYASILSELGYLVHYGGDATLKNTVILKPDWLSKAVSFVLEDKRVKDQNGLIEHNRLGELWNDPVRPESERYPVSLHTVFRLLMERFDLSYEVTIPAGCDKLDTSLIAQLVPGARPPSLAEHWPDSASAGDAEKVQICRIVEAETGQPSRADGLMYRLIVRLHRYSMGRNDYNHSCHWQRGIVLDDKFNGRAIIEHIGDDFRITVRAAYPERLLHHLCEEVKLLVDHFWKGLDCQIAVPCSSATCKGVLSIEALLEARQQGQPKYPCSVCRKWLDIDLLLSKPAGLPEIHVALAELKRGQAEIKEGLEDGISLVRADLRALISQADERYAQLMGSLTNEAKEGPRVFSLEPVETSVFNPDGWAKKKFRVTLWCEHTRLPLPLINKNTNEGVYELEVTRDWFAKAAPFLQVLAGTLSLVLPVAASAIKLALEDANYKVLEHRLDLGKECANAMLAGGKSTLEWASEKEGLDLESTGVIRADGGALREFQTWLRKEDPSFGDLRRVLNKRQEFLWVHRNFEKEY